jgi:hypothetical protein
MSPIGKKSRPARRRTNQPAWMTVDGGFAARQCTVIDISEGGARLRVEDPLRPVAVSTEVRPDIARQGLQGHLEKGRRDRDQVHVA